MNPTFLLWDLIAVKFIFTTFRPDSQNISLMKKLVTLCIIPLLAICLILTSCESFNGDNGFSSNGPEIEWVEGGNTITNSYRSGTVTAYNFKRSVTVSKDSGEVEISLHKMGDKENVVSGTFVVEEGKQYKVSVQAGISGRRTVSGSESCFSVVFESPNCRKDYEIQVPSFYVPSYNEWMPDMDYCPESFSFGEVIISE